MRKAGDGLQENIVDRVRVFSNEVVHVQTRDVLHENESSILLRKNKIVEDAYDVQVVNLMKQLYLSQKVAKELFPVRIVERRVLLADEVFLNLIVVKKDSLSAGTRPQFLDEFVVSSTQESYYLGLSLCVLFHRGVHCLKQP